MRRTVWIGKRQGRARPGGWTGLAIAVAFSSFTPVIGAVTPFADVVADHLRRYPQMEMCDLYKICYQAAMGNVHMQGPLRSLQSDLNEELLTVQPAGDLPLAERISPDGEVVRIHLQPFKKGGYDPALLAEACWLSARAFKPSLKRLRLYWQSVIALSREGGMPFSAPELHAFFRRMEKEKFPAVHHSQTYMRLYAPAYRVVMKRFADKFGG